MLNFGTEFIQNQIADSRAIYHRGIQLYEYGAYIRAKSDIENGQFVFKVDGNYGDYSVRIKFHNGSLETSCDCPYPGKGCKHIVAVLLDVLDQIEYSKKKTSSPEILPDETQDSYMTPEEIRNQAIEDRKRRSEMEAFKPILGDMIKGRHQVETTTGKIYTVTVYDPETESGHCNCPDFASNRLNICKHLLFITKTLRKEKNFKKRIRKERFPFIDIYWDSETNAPRLFSEFSKASLNGIGKILDEFFNEDGTFKKGDISQLLIFMAKTAEDKRIRIQQTVVEKIDNLLMDRQLSEIARQGMPSLDGIKAKLYPYQMKGVEFALYKKAALIGDDMGLGKTLQAIVIAILKKKIFDFNNILVITMASLKEQWKREIERFTNEKGIVIEGNPYARETLYKSDEGLFKIANYEAVLRDVSILTSIKPDLIILDEAQRIKNFNTKTADAVKRIPRKHALVLTGTPLENKLEDVYSIVQFLDPDLLSPLWQFAADHFMLSRKKKGKIVGYRNLDKLHDKLKSIVIRRKKEDVLSDLPDQIVNNYFLDMDVKQQEMHANFARALMRLLNKKFLTAMDHKRIMELLLCMRRVCDSTYLIDRQTQISPKLKELGTIIDEIVLQNRRKMVIFSEWTTMTYLIGKYLSSAKIPFVELTGKIPVKKRQLLIDEFSNNPDCCVFLSTDAGGTGLNLQAADCIVNFELPWNPSRMNQRIGRVNRIGQKSKCINVVNLIMKSSIEEKILAGIQLKTDLFQGVFEGGIDVVEFSNEKRTEMFNRLRQMMGEESGAVATSEKEQVELDVDTPHFLNPEVLSETEDENTETFTDEESALDGPSDIYGHSQKASSDEKGNILANQSPEKIESVLNSGMEFISGLLEMATGKKIEKSVNEEKMIRIDRQTGEVTMKFKLPGF